MGTQDGSMDLSYGTGTVSKSPRVRSIEVGITQIL